MRRPADEILAEVRERTADLPGIEVQTQTPRAGPGGEKPISIQVSSRYPALLDTTVAAIREVMNHTPGLEDVEDSRPLPGIEWRVRVDRAQAARFGADVALVGNTIQLVTNGVKIGEYRPDDADDIVFRHQPGHDAVHVATLFRQRFISKDVVAGFGGGAPCERGFGIVGEMLDLYQLSSTL